MKIQEIKGHWELVSCYLNWSKNGSFLKKVSQKQGFHRLLNMPIFSIFEHFEKLLDFERLRQPNHMTYSEPQGISGKIRSISFIWLPLVPSVTNGLDTVRVRKTGLILNMPEIRSISSSYVLYASSQACCSARTFAD